MNLKDPKIQRIVISVVLVIIMGVVFEFGILRAKRKKIKEFTSTYTELNTRVEKARNVAGKYKSLEMRLDSLNKEWDMLERKLPQEEEIPSLLNSLARLGEMTNVEFLLFKPLPKDIHEYYTANPIEIKLMASYHQLGFFLSRIINMERLVNISNLTLAPPPKKSKEAKQGITLEASFIATAYTITKPGEYKPPEKQEGKKKKKK